MTEFEQKIWAAVYGATYGFGYDTDQSQLEATNAVVELRALAEAGKTTGAVAALMGVEP